MFELQFDKSEIQLSLAKGEVSLLKKIFGRSKRPNLDTLTDTDRDLVLAIADLRESADLYGENVEIKQNRIVLSHKLAASLDANTAKTLGFPKVVDLVLRTDVEGNVGSKNFRLKAEWFKNGLKQFPKRTGCILETSAGLRRLPLWLLEAVEIADHYTPGSSDIADWGALARFRQALDPGVQIGEQNSSARASMTDFLTKLQVRVADRFSIAPNDSIDDFEVVPFSDEIAGRQEELGGIREADSEISGNELASFQSRLRERGALPAYRLGSGNFLVIDKGALPALKVMQEMQLATAEARSAFIKNPRPRITQAIYDALKEEGRLEGLSDDAEAEIIETVAEPVFVETKEFFERVTGVKVFQRPEFDGFEASGTTWFPEQFRQEFIEALKKKSPEELQQIKSDLEVAIKDNKQEIKIDDVPIPANQEAVELVEGHIVSRRKVETIDGEQPKSTVTPGPIVLDGGINIDDLKWTAKLRPRTATCTAALPETIKTDLKPHQIDSFNWQVEAWKAGLPGILNADEQGLGKTLQTIAFLAWLKRHMENKEASHRGPVLVVAPTSLLENWEQEVERHMEDPGLGHLIRLYGSAISARKLPGRSGVDTQTGEVKLDLKFLTEAIEENRAHRFWILTTYTTLTNYQHSLARIPFSAIVFDEIQTLKNPASLRAVAALFMNGDFRIGLTGTPIENSAIDLWAIIEQLVAGALGTFKQFKAQYGVPNKENMAELHDKVFKPIHAPQPIALRRLKEHVARDLPEKTRFLHPRLMPSKQTIVYERARLKLAEGGLGAALKMLHHIRSVSVHPSLDEQMLGNDFINLSARLKATFDILKGIKGNRERVLVFIEHRQMQYRFIELARAEFGLNHIDLINGDTPIPKRQAIVNRFQAHLGDDGGFDILVLGPKAAGVGLTLTAATHVIHLSRWWNPAVEEQCNDRTHRIGQTKPVTIHMPMAIHPGFQEDSFDCLLQSLMQRKRRLAASALWPMGDTDEDAAELQKLLGQDPRKERADALQASIDALFLRDGLPKGKISADGSIRLP